MEDYIVEKHGRKFIFKTDNVDEIKEHINNVLIEYIVQKVKENM